MSRFPNKLIIFLFIFIVYFIFTPSYYAEDNYETKIKQLERQVEELEKKLTKKNEQIKTIEPTVPQEIKDPPWGNPPFPTKISPISEIITNGKQIPFRVLINKPEYKRAAYENHWHSTYGRWSYIPTRIHYALHRLYTEYDIGGSNWYDFEHNMGLSIPMLQDKKSLDLYIVAFQTEVIKVITKGNQIVVIGKPKRNGVMVITIKTKDLNPDNKDEFILTHLATKSGDELDYSLISYGPPDYWSKKKD
jgi:hypothetical protein